MDQDQIGAYDDCLVILDDDEEEVSVSKDASVDCIVIDDDEEEEISDSKGRIKTESELNIPYNKGDGYNFKNFQDSSSRMDIRNEDTTAPRTSRIGQKQGSPQPLGKEFVVQERSFQCSDCDKLHFKGTPVQCSQCGKEFTKLSVFKRHLAIHARKNGDRCMICGEEFLVLESFKFHCQYAHKDTKELSNIPESVPINMNKIEKDLEHESVKDLQFDCSECGKSFCELGRFKNHLKTHGMLFHCSQCLKGFTEVSVLKVHLAKHARKIEYECVRCGEDFLELKTLKFHCRYAHLKAPPNIADCITININQMGNDCSECGKNFFSARHLELHLMSHAKLFNCSECGKSFRRHKHLVKHLLEHE